MASRTSKQLSELGFTEGLSLREVLELAAAAQAFRTKNPDPGAWTAPVGVTRSSALWAAAEWDLQVRAGLGRGGLHWKGLAASLGLTDRGNLEKVKSFDLDDELREALKLFRSRFPESTELNTARLAFAILHHVVSNPDKGVLPERLRALGVDAERVLTVMERLVANDRDSRRTGEEKAPTRSPRKAERRRGARTGEPVRSLDPEEPPAVYISYSHKDKDWRDRLRKHLQPFVAAEALTVFDDEGLRVGQAWRHELERMQEKSVAAVLLVSPDSLASKSIVEWEMPHLRGLFERNEIRLLPLLVRDAPWAAVEWLREIQLAPSGAIPLEALERARQEELLTEFANRVAEVVAEVAGSPAAPANVEGIEEVDATEPRDEPEGEHGSPDPSERVPTHRDDPARVDELGRRPFADVVAMRMQEIWDGSDVSADSPGPVGPGRSFAVHLHGPWGSGKTSVLNFLRETLQDGESRNEPWVVVEFNAWRNQRIRPPWWSLIREVYRQSRDQLGFPGRWRLRWRWWSWRFRADWLPVLLAGLVLALLVLLVGGAVGLFQQAPEETTSADWGKRLETALKILATLLAAGAGATALGRSLLLGSAKAAQSYVELRGDPMGPVARLFEALARGIRRPLAVFIDDLDRCDGNYVVDLLEGIQTLFRRAKVSYVVAADRDWIRTSFERRYEHFAGPIAQPGRPLGHLFLEKLFQVSAAVPLLSPETSRRYWLQLLGGTAPDGADTVEDANRRAERVGETLLGGAVRQEDIQRVLDEHEGAAEEPGLRAAAAKRISTPEAREEAEHLLAPLASLLEPNPRAMKRLVNAYGIHQAVSFLEGRRVEAEPLARWTILELRWPLLADLLKRHSYLVEKVGAKRDPTDPRIPEELRQLFTSPAVLEVVKGNSTTVAGAPLTCKAIQRIVGHLTPAPPLEAGVKTSAAGPRPASDNGPDRASA